VRKDLSTRAAERKQARKTPRNIHNL